MKERHDKSCLPCTSHHALCFSELFKSHRAREGGEVTAGLSHRISLGPQPWTLGREGLERLEGREGLEGLEGVSEVLLLHYCPEADLWWRERERQIKLVFFPLCSLEISL